MGYVLSTQESQCIAQSLSCRRAHTQSINTHTHTHTQGVYMHMKKMDLSCQYKDLVLHYQKCLVHDPNG